MRTYIMGFRQDVLLKIGITEKELYLVDYLVKFFESGCAYARCFDGELYYLVTSDKVLQDMPFVICSERRLREILASLCKKNIIKKQYSENHMYIAINYKLLHSGEDKGGENPPSISEIQAEYSNKGGGIPPIIIKYIKNKIYIYYNLNKKVQSKDVDADALLKKLKIQFFSTMSEASYGVCISKMKFRSISPNLMVMDVGFAMPAVKKFHTKTVENGVKIVLEDLGLVG